MFANFFRVKINKMMNIIYNFVFNVINVTVVFSLFLLLLKKINN